MKYSFILSIAILLASCSGDNAAVPRSDANAYATGSLPTAAVVQEQTTLPTAPTAGGVVEDALLGRKLTAQGDIPPAERTDRFAKGEEIHIAIKVQPPAPPSDLRVAWYGPDDSLLGEDAKRLTEGGKYVSFSTADSAHWDPGAYRAEVWLDDEKIAEQRFAVATE